MDNSCTSEEMQPKKRRKFNFWIFMLIYGAALLVIAAVGLGIFWDYIDAYEASRTKGTIENYVAELTPQYICDRSAALIASIDHNIQSEEACKQVILDFLTGDITYARKFSECTDTRMVYVLRRGSNIIGKVELVPQGETRHGFTPWVIDKDSFDLSFLVGSKATITVDYSMQVYANDVLLDESYVTETGLQYEAVKDFYEELELPYKMTYTAGPVLGETVLRAVDTNGQTVTISAESDLDPYLNNCTDAVHQELDTYIRDFINRYTRYLTSRLDNRQENYRNLTPLLVRGSDLYNRVSRAYDGFEYGQSKSDTITDFVTHYLIHLGDNKYLCDVTYEVDSLGRDGKLHHSVNNARVFLVRTDNGLKAERLISY